MTLATDMTPGTPASASSATAERVPLRRRLPKPVRSVLGAARHYVQRLDRWRRILGSVRGECFGDTLRLLGSAAAAPVVSLRGLLRWQDPVLLGDCRVRVPGVGRFELRSRTDDLWHAVPWREQELTDLLRERLSPGGVFVDAGANIGVYSVMASSLVGPAGRVVSFEMIPSTAALLRRHLELNDGGNVTVVERALYSEAGQTVTAHVPEDRFGLSSIAESDRGGATVSVETTTLDASCADLDRIDVLKLDLEGAEEGALQGATETLAKTAAVVMEANRDWADPAVQILRDAGFEIHPLMKRDILAVRPVDRLSTSREA